MPSGELTEEDLKKMSAEEIAELQKQNCIFCKIVKKEIPAKIVHEDKDTICILDINPAAEGHILVLPKEHFMIMPHMTDEVLAKVFKSVKLMSQTLLKTFQCKGTTVFVANGAAAGQRAPHVIVHVFPRRENDGLVNLPNYEMNEDHLEKLRSGLKPYMSHIFGARKGPIVKEAEFSDKKIEQDIEAVKKDPVTSKLFEEEKLKQENQDAEENEDESEDSEPEEKSEPVKVKPKESNSKDVKGKEKTQPSNNSSKPKGKVDLDDIAKLFG
jgi:histidine triad (HIT) family protein